MRLLQHLDIAAVNNLASVLQSRDVLAQMPTGTAEDWQVIARRLEKLPTSLEGWAESLREAAGITQADLAERVNLRYYTFISQVESGLGRVPIEAQALWAGAVGADPTEFARTLLRYYEPELHRLLFPAETAGRAARKG